MRMRIVLPAAAAVAITVVAVISFARGAEKSVAELGVFSAWVRAGPPSADRHQPEVNPAMVLETADD